MTRQQYIDGMFAELMSHRDRYILLLGELRLIKREQEYTGKFVALLQQQIELEQAAVRSGETRRV